MIKTNTITAPVLSHGTATGNNHLAEYAKVLRGKYTVKRKVLFIQTLQFQLDAFNRDVAKNKGYYVYPPTGLQCLAKSLMDRNIEIDILDLNYQLLKRVIEDDSFDPLNWLDILDEYLAKNNPSIIGVTCIGVSTNLFKSTHPLTAVLRHLSEKNKHIILAGGTLAADEYKDYLGNELSHFVIQGEGENKINFLFDYLLDETPPEAALKGIYFKYEGVIRQTRGKKDEVALGGNLIETYKHVPIEDYNNVGSLNPFSRMVGQETHFTGIQLNRGCRADCQFCGVTKFMGRGVRQYPQQDLFEEMVYLIEERGIRHFELLDDDFLAPSTLREGVTELLKNMCHLKEKYGITWSAGNGLIASAITSEAIQLIHDSGCVGFRIGIESGNTEMLRRMRKPSSVKTLKRFVTMLQQYPNIFVGVNYIIGLFGEETFGQMLETYRLSCELDVDWASYSTFQFTSKTTTEAEDLKDDGKGATECIPSKDAANREIRVAEGLLSGPDIFNILQDTVPSREQVREIWFGFNLLSNYIYNKNLMPGGNPGKLIRWIEAIQITYPKNPYMPLFTALGYVLLNDKKSAQNQLHKAKVNMQGSVYWENRFVQFGLLDLIQHFPQTANEVYQILESIEKRFDIAKVECISSV